MSAELPFTGERFIPGVPGEIWIEHWHRYHFATRWARGRRVLDVACGAGYGTALLARTAAAVTGADISEAAIAHARAAYGALPNARFECVPCTRLPLADASVDVVVSFETLEHIAEQEAFLDEAARVLAADGVLLLSCPNKLEYSDKRGFANEFHVRELYREELARLLGTRFPELAWYGQRPAFYSVIAAETPEGAGEVFEVSEAAAAEAAPALSRPLYFIVAAGRRRESLAPGSPALSVFADRDDWVHKDYEKVMHELREAVDHNRALDSRLKEERAKLDEAGSEIAALREKLRAAEADLAVRSSTLADRDRELADREVEVKRRGGLRWWLRLPLVRFGLLKE
jgi:SAM-dependent methyltransferase